MLLTLLKFVWYMNHISMDEAQFYGPLWNKTAEQ
jgi:hypothetical protein